MIILSEVAQKLEEILNGLDSETTGYTNPTSFYFQVETEGFHIDHIERKDKSGNFIPVFISSMGGQFNPVKGLKQGSYTLPIVFYFPVRFKNDMFALADFLVDIFVGTKLNYGDISGKAVSNISAPQFGEIQNLDFKEFSAWVNSKFQKSIEVMEPYLSMQINLYLSNAAPGLIYGNDIQASLSFKYKGNTYTLDDVDFDSASLQSNSQTQSEQEEGTNESDSLPFGTAYGASYKIYPNLNSKSEEGQYVQVPSVDDWDANTVYYRKNGDDYISVGTLTYSQFVAALGNWGALYTLEPFSFYEELLKVWFAGDIQEVECQIQYKINESLIFTRKCFIQSIMAPIEKGQLFALTLTFAKKSEEEEENA